MRGFTLVEVVVVLALAALLVGAALPSYRGHVQRAARLDAVEALTRLQAAQERHRATHGWYASDLAALGASGQSMQGLYALAISSRGAESYVARAEARGSQAGDRECSELTVEVAQGFARTGPNARCWNR